MNMFKLILVLTLITIHKEVSAQYLSIPQIFQRAQIVNTVIKVSPANPLFVSMINKYKILCGDMTLNFSFFG